MDQRPHLPEGEEDEARRPAAGLRTVGLRTAAVTASVILAVAAIVVLHLTGVIAPEGH